MVAEKHFLYWVGLTLFSVISLGSLTNLASMDVHQKKTGQQDWEISVASISLIMSGLACIFYLVMKERFAGKSVEVGWVSFSMGGMSMFRSQDLICNVLGRVHFHRISSFWPSGAPGFPD